MEPRAARILRYSLRCLLTYMSTLRRLLARALPTNNPELYAKLLVTC